MFTEGIPGSSPVAAIIIWVLLAVLWISSKLSPGFRVSVKPLPFRHPEL